MSTATKRPPRIPKQSTGGNGSIPTPAAPPSAEATEDVPLHLIAPSPFQKRRVFDSAELQSLANSIKQHGLLQPIVLRAQEVGAAPLAPKGRTRARYELLAGERRLRAAVLLKLPTIRATVRDVDSREAMLIVATENQQRADLNPIEKAETYRLLTAPLEAGGGGFTQRKLAEELGLTQGAISNTVRLLELPEFWQGAVISGEIGTACARALVPYKGLPAVMKDMKNLLATSLRHDGPPAVDMWTDNLEWKVDANTKPMSGELYMGKYGRMKVFTASDEQREQLAIITDGDGDPRATNVKLWNKLQDAHAKACASQKKKGGGAKAAGGKTKGAGKKAKKLTAAQEKAAAKKAAEQFARRLYAWKIDWLRWLCEGKVREGARRQSRWIEAKLLLYFATSKAGDDRMYNGLTMGRRADDLRDVLRARGVKMKDGGRAASWGWLSTVPHGLLFGVVVDLLCLWLWDKEGKAPSDALPFAVVEGLAKDLEVDLVEAWNLDRAGPLTEQYFEIHNREQLEKLAGELDVHLGRCKTKADVVKHLMANKRPGIPREVAKARG